MYNKLFTKILDSSIWLEPAHVRLVWVTFLAMMDQDGTVALSGIGNVANRARVSEQEATDAIRVLESPDERNPGQELDGRRIERIPGVGWVVLNSKKYRDIIKAETNRVQTRERVARHRRNADVTVCNKNVTPSDAEAGSKTGRVRAPPPHPDIMDGMDQDETPIELAKPLPPIPMRINWRDWRSHHGEVRVARKGDDGDPEAWETMFDLYGQEIFDAMYKALKATGKPVYYNLACAWLEKNTRKKESHVKV